MNTLVANLIEEIKEKKFLIGIATGSGSIARVCQQDGADLLFVTNSGKFRQNGHSSLCGFMPYENSNQIVFHTTVHEILPITDTIPVITGINAHDSFTNIHELIDLYKSNGVLGISNYPTVSSIDGNYRECLDISGYTFDREMKMLEYASECGLFTVAFVMTKEEILQCINYNIDMICVDLGLTKGGYFGGNPTMNIRDFSQKISELYDYVKNFNSNIIFGVYGGPLSSPSDINLFYHFLQIDAFIGGSIFERIPLENNSKQFFSEINNSRFLFSTPSFPLEDKDYVSTCLKYIDSHYYEDLSLSYLSDICHISSPYLSKIFHDKVGVSFSTYLTDIRIQKSMDLMKFSSLSLNQISELTGFSDYSYYSKVFRKKNGISPHQYRMENNL